MVCTHTWKGRTLTTTAKCPECGQRSSKTNVVDGDVNDDAYCRKTETENATTLLRYHVCTKS